MFGGWLLLPEQHIFNLPGLPPIGKALVAALAGLLGACLFQPRRLLAAGPGAGLEAVALLMIPAALGTALTNRDPIVLANKVIPGLRAYDAVGMAFEDVMLLGVPFLLGRAFFRTSRDVRLALVAIVVSSLAYSLLVLVEARMSPMMNKLVYGYSQHTWVQVRRFGGWRPMVFMHHGLALSLFVAVSVIAAATLARARLRVLGVPAGAVVAYLGFVLLACRSLAALVYGVVVAPLILVARPRRQMVVAALGAGVLLTYPLLRGLDLVPTDQLAAVARSVSGDRAESLEFRFRNERPLLERARQRPFFGWGGFGRSHYPETMWERDLVADGYWILRLTSRGLAGMLGYAVLFSVPVLLAWRRFGGIHAEGDRVLLAGFALVVTIHGLDTIPNGLWTNAPLLLAGGLAGAARGMPREARARRAAGEPQGPGAVPPAPEPARRPPRSPVAAPARPSRGPHPAARRGPRGRR
jgi:hypothetical protein